MSRTVVAVAAALLVAACSSAGGSGSPVVTANAHETPTSVPGYARAESSTAPSLPGPGVDQTSDTFAVAPPSTTSTTTTTQPPTTTTTQPPTTTTTRCNAVTLPADVLFDTNEWQLRPGADEALAAVATEIVRRADRIDVHIVGHTDSRGSDESNQRLSERRARSVMEWYVAWFAQEGITPESVTSEGRGERELLVDDTSASGEFLPEQGQMNRRVEIEATGISCS